MLRARFLSLLAACAACSSASTAPEPRVVLATDRAAYAPGDTVRVVMRNVSAEDFGYNLCLRHLERHANVWRTAYAFPQGGACTQELRTLAPGDSVATRQVIPADALPGTYRVRFDPARPASDETATPAFRVGPES